MRNDLLNIETVFLLFLFNHVSDPDNFQAMALGPPQGHGVMMPKESTCCIGISPFEFALLSVEIAHQLSSCTSFSLYAFRPRPRPIYVENRLKMRFVNDQATPSMTSTDPLVMRYFRRKVGVGLVKRDAAVLTKCLSTDDPFEREKRDTSKRGFASDDCCCCCC